MKLKFCSCRMCKYGRKKFGNPKMITRMKRAARHRNKARLKKFDWEKLEDFISIPYTD